jgi:uncharacterized membrane protein YkvI
MGRMTLDVLRVAATYTGTVVGAGFASGQELMQFFVSFGAAGLLGICLAGILFAWLGSYILELGHRLRATGYHQILRYSCGSRIGGILDFITVFFLFGSLTIMFAGAGTVGRDYLEVSYTTGLLAIAAVVAATVMTGMKGISLVNTLVTPLLVISTVIIGIRSLVYHGISPDILAIPARAPSDGMAAHWALSALLYVSYNLILGATVLAPLGCQIRDRSARMYGGLLGGLILMLLGLFVVVIIILHCPAVLDYEVPMLYVSDLQNELTHTGYAVMLIKAMYSTAMASLYGCTAKLAGALRLKFSICLLIVTAAALVCSQAGFAALISLLYPLFGYVSLIFTLTLIWNFVRGK